MDLGRPLYLDEECRDFPELTVIAGLGGWPWVPELVEEFKTFPYAIVSGQNGWVRTQQGY
jgi:predicted TIM-barrel fold metal-dependent hydrolase